ncbi:MAG: DUF4350 domain-containing protein [Chloroflexi bacterium]|nr:DUF4350 domain-containing protein [Chloroflexota bacterium]
MSSRAGTYTQTGSGRQSEVMITLGLFVMLVILVVALGRSGQPPRAYDLKSGAPNGLLGLRLWLQEMGFQVSTNEGKSFKLPDSTDMLFVYPNTTLYTGPEAQTVADWVEGGHTLVIVGPDAGDKALVETFGVSSEGSVFSSFSNTLHQQQPLLPETGTDMGGIDFEPRLNLEQAPDAVAVVATDQDFVTVAVQRRGEGTIWYLSPRHDLANADLKEVQESALVPALLRTVPAQGRIVFDTYHLFGPQGAENGPTTLQDWLYVTPVGWALLFCVAIFCAFLLLQGTRLGPPLPVVSPMRRREAAEYVEAMATLQRRAHKRQAVARYHKRRLKVGLGKELNLGIDSSDMAFLQALQNSDTHIDPALLQTVRQLFDILGSDPGESALVQAVAKVDDIFKHYRK